MGCNGNPAGRLGILWEKLDTLQILMLSVRSRMAAAWVSGGHLLSALSGQVMKDWFLDLVDVATVVA